MPIAVDGMTAPTSTECTCPVCDCHGAATREARFFNGGWWATYRVCATCGEEEPWDRVIEPDAPPVRARRLARAS